jgi:type II secretory ATPase GspE/PulE/Tfp pilus assembly ATPase PilB-like protein
LLAKSVVNNDPVSLGRYINVKELRNNFYRDIYEFSLNLINVMDKNIRIKSESIELAGELTPTFLEKLFSRMSNNISTDFSSPEIMLYFYFNSNELSTYLNKSFTHFGDYNFEKYLLEKQSENVEEAENNEDEKEAENNKEEAKEEAKEEEENSISKLIQRIKSTDYFFLTSPIHFKIDVKHQDIPFILILKFNGYIWEVQKITIPYKELIDPKNISLSN